RYGGAWRTVHDGVDVGRYAFVRSVAPDAPLIFLGRLEAVKGAHHAIAIARGAGRKLIIAGNPAAGAEAARDFEERVAPHRGGGGRGAVADAQKNELLGQAAALLMPVDWEEPFGIVMAEALACGTPVVGFARGAVPEVIRDGVNGFLCRSVAEAVAAVGHLPRI